LRKSLCASRSLLGADQKVSCCNLMIKDHYVRVTNKLLMIDYEMTALRNVCEDEDELEVVVLREEQNHKRMLPRQHLIG
jgi:hypothetical protein